jgi:hypothetical protein
MSIVVHSRAAEPHDPLPVAGITLRLASSEGFFTPSFLMNEAGQIVAALSDPLALLPKEPSRVVLDTERTSYYEGNGAPILKVTSRLPEFWAQPASFEHFAKGPGAYSGFGRDAQIKDFAGIPFETLRAYERDNGARAGSRIFSGPRPVTISSIQTIRGAASLSIEAVAGLKYVLLFSPTVTGAYREVEEIVPESDGAISLPLTTQNSAGFYKIQVVQQ